MRRTRKHNKIYRRTRRGGGKGTLKIVPPLLPSPNSTAPASPILKTNKPELKVGNTNLEPVKPRTHNWYIRQRPRVVLEKIKQPSLWNRLFGRKPMPNKAVTVNSEGAPIRSAFQINNKNNRGFKS